MFATSCLSVIARGTSHCMEFCDHEEADTRMVVHLQDALDTASNTCLVRTVGTDVVTIFIGKCHALTTNHPAADVWIAFGTGKNFIYIHINTFFTALGRNKSIALPIFHCFTGCDTTFAFLEGK